ncbi:MAG TPA: MBL fold metallo-hydrolase [Spirochaetota bacterium]|nr:MBL fold metallo-hydrolase [Spirochaetota bacterium]
MTIEVFPGIFKITETGALGLLKPPINIYVVAGSNGIVFDGGYGNRGAVRRFVKDFGAIQEQCRREGRDFSVSRVLLSHAHPDHFAGLRGLRDTLGFRVMMTQRSAEMIATKERYRDSYHTEDEWWEMAYPSAVTRNIMNFLRQPINRYYEHLYGTSFLDNPDIVIEENGSIPVNGESWNVLHVPGHAEDHIALYDPLRGILFAGDNIMRSMTTWLGPPKSDLDSYMKSLVRMRDLPGLKLVLSAHGSPVTNPVERIQELLDIRSARTGQVRDIVADSGHKGIVFRDILEKLYPGAGLIKRMAAEGWVQTTLQYLIKHKKIELLRHGGTISFRLQ